MKAKRGVPSSADSGAPESFTPRSLVAGPAVAIVTVLMALLGTHAAGVTFRDPNHMIERRLIQVGYLMALLVALDIVIRAGRRSWRPKAWLAAMRAVRRERWTWHRAAAVAIALVSFYVTYLAYRNLKSVVPLLRPGDLFDRQLADFERGLFAGTAPAGLLHSILGTGAAAEILSKVYMAFILLVPVSLALALVFSPSTQGAIFYAAALSINWALGAACYLALPALGPIYAAPAGFADLPATGASHLQDVLLRQRLEFLSDPAAANAHQSIAAFASLHTSIVFTAAVAAHMLGLGRWLRIATWVVFGLTAIATIYFGWHYVVDDVAGLAIGLTALALARSLTGFEPHRVRWLRIPKRAGMPVRVTAAQSGQDAHVQSRATGALRGDDKRV